MAKLGEWPTADNLLLSRSQAQTPLSSSFYLEPLSSSMLHVKGNTGMPYVVVKNINKKHPEVWLESKTGLENLP